MITVRRATISSVRAIIPVTGRINLIIIMSMHTEYYYRCYEDDYTDEQKDRCNENNVSY